MDVLITAIATIVAAYLGARFGGGYVVRGVLLSAEKAEEAAFHNGHTEVANLRKALYAEIVSLRDNYMRGIGQRIENAPDTQPFNWYYPADQRYFVIFEENASAIGRIPDDRERELIVKAYTQAKGLLDSYLFNNKLVEKYAYVIGLGVFVLGPNGSHVQKMIEDQMRGYTPLLKQLHTETMDLINGLSESLAVPLAQPIRRTNC